TFLKGVAIHAQPADTIIIPINKSGFDIIKFSRTYGKSCYENSIAFDEIEHIECGQPLVAEAGKNIFVPRIEHELVFIEVVSTKRLARLDFFDLGTGAYSGDVVTDNFLSRIEFLTAALVSLEAKSSLPALSELLKHHEHVVRWQTARHMLCIDLEYTIPHVKKLQFDQNIDVRRAAAETLSLLGDNLNAI
ncbi:HEAT repeat domain-containing protein, partial [Acetobacter tropicalis]